ncbi:MAG: CoA-transferase [Candidatus Caldarchaeum sp.]
MSSSNMSYTPSELLAVLTARMLEDGKTVFVGVGIPMISASLAQKLHAPNIVIVFEGGIVAPQMKSHYLPLSTNEVRAARRALALPPINEIFFYQQRGYIDYAIIGGAQVDKYGNVNTSVIGDHSNPRVRLPGSGGGNDIASTCTNVIISTLLEKRRFVERVDFITSPGYLEGYGSRERSGLIFGKPFKVVTDMCIMGFDDETKTMKIEALLQGVSLEQVFSNMGFKPLVADDLKIIDPPTAEEIRLLREIDPEKLILK